MEAAYELHPLVAFKLIVYTFGALVYLFLMVLILGNRWLRRLEWLLFALIAALFLWNAGNLLGLNVGLFYGVGPALLMRLARLLSLAGLILVPPLLVQVHLDYLARSSSIPRFARLLSAIFYVPLIAAPGMMSRLASQLNLGPLPALGGYAKVLAAWLVATLLLGAAIDAVLARRRPESDAGLGRLHAWLAVVEIVTALGLAWVYLFRPISPEGLGGGAAGFLMLLAVAPGGLVALAIFRHNLLDLRIQRNVMYSVTAIFGLLLYINFMRRIGGLLEAHRIVPSAVTEAVMIFLLVVFLEPVKKLIDRFMHEAFVSEFEKIQKLAAEIQDFAKQAGDVESLGEHVELRLAAELGLERVSLRTGAVDLSEEQAQKGKVRRFSVHRGSEVVAWLDVTPRTSNLSGEQYGALEFLADQLAPALEVCRLIADKVKLERELAEKEKMAFLGDMAARIAHNVKNPLSSMKTLVQLLERDSSLPSRAREDCGIVSSEIDRLNRKVSQLLRYAKQAAAVDESCDLAAVVQRIVAVSQAEAARLGVKLDCTVDCASSSVAAGEEAASDIASNLVVNALEATPAGRSVMVRIVADRTADGAIALHVEDQGAGIAAAVQEKIFQPFYTTRPGGTGLGLAIVRRRAEEVGGSVECVSPLDAKGGTRFTVKFRLAAAA